MSDFTSSPCNGVLLDKIMRPGSDTNTKTSEIIARVKQNPFDYPKAPRSRYGGLPLDIVIHGFDFLSATDLCSLMKVDCYMLSVVGNLFTASVGFVIDTSISMTAQSTVPNKLCYQVCAEAVKQALVHLSRHTPVRVRFVGDVSGTELAPFTDRLFFPSQLLEGLVDVLNKHSSYQTQTNLCDALTGSTGFENCQRIVCFTDGGENRYATVESLFLCGTSPRMLPTSTQGMKITFEDAFERHNTVSTTKNLIKRRDNGFINLLRLLGLFHEGFACAVVDVQGNQKITAVAGVVSMSIRSEEDIVETVHQAIVQTVPRGYGGGRGSRSVSEIKDANDRRIRNADPATYALSRGTEFVENDTKTTTLIHAAWRQKMLGKKLQKESCTDTIPLNALVRDAQGLEGNTFGFSGKFRTSLAQELKITQAARLVVVSNLLKDPKVRKRIEESNYLRAEVKAKSKLNAIKKKVCVF
jgi:hypothetical protein